MGGSKDCQLLGLSKRQTKSGLRRPGARQSSASPTGNEAEKKLVLKVDLKFGVQRFKRIPFSKAVDMIYNNVVIERKHFELYVRRMKEDHYFADAVSRLLAKTANVKPPTYKMWEKPIGTLIKAMSKQSEAYTYTGYERRRRLLTARYLLAFAVSDYNKVHKAWYEYRNQLEKGAKASILMMEITIILLSTAIGAGAAGRIASSVPKIFAHTTRARAIVLVKQAAAGAGISFGTQSAKAIGMKLQGVEDINYGKIILNTLTGFITGVAGGALAGRFLSMLTPRLATSLSSSSVLQPLAYTPTQKVVTNFLGNALGADILKSAINATERSFRGKKVTVDAVLQNVIKEMSTRNAQEVFKHFLKATGKI